MSKLARDEIAKMWTEIHKSHPELLGYREIYCDECGAEYKRVRPADYWESPCEHSTYDVVLTCVEQK